MTRLKEYLLALFGKFCDVLGVVIGFGIVVTLVACVLDTPKGVKKPAIISGEGRIHVHVDPYLHVVCYTHDAQISCVYHPALQVEGRGK